MDEAKLLEDIHLAVGPDSDRDALGRVYDVYYPRVLGFVRKKIGSNHAFDLTQDTFIRVQLNRTVVSFSEVGKFNSWLFRIAVNVCRSWRTLNRAKKRPQNVESLDDMDPHEFKDFGSLTLVPSGDESDSLAKSITAEQRDLVAREIWALPDQMRRCMALNIYDELKYREIGMELGISVGTVKAHLFRGRERLRENLSKSQTA